MRRRARRLRVAPYFQIVLAGQPEYSGPLRIRARPVARRALLREPAEHVPHGAGLRRASPSGRSIGWRRERGRFFGAGREPRSSLRWWNTASRTTGRTDDDRPVAALLATLDLPAHGEHTVVVLLGQADDRERAEAVDRASTGISTPRAPASRRPGGGGSASWTRSGSRRPESGVRSLPGLAEVPGARRAHLGPARVLPGQRRLRLPRPAPGLGEPDLDGPRRGAPADPAARLPAVHSKATSSTGSICSRTAGPASSGGRTPRTTSSGWPGPWSSTSRRPATSRSSTSGRPTSRRSSRSSRCRPGSTGWASTPCDRLASDTVYRHCLKAIDLVLDQRMGVARAAR